MPDRPNAGTVTDEATLYAIIDYAATALAVIVIISGVVKQS